MNCFRRIRRWWIDKYLPAYVSTANREDIVSMQKEINRLKAELTEERAYSLGLEKAVKQRIVINNR